MKLGRLFWLSPAIFCVLLQAQVGHSTFGAFTPRGLEPGSPDGSYALTGLDTVNLYNGRANISIPLMQVGGLGEAGYTILANVTPYPWNVNAGTLQGITPAIQFYFYGVGSSWANVDNRYKPAVIAARQANDFFTTMCTDPNTGHQYSWSGINNTVTRITLYMGDGTEMEFVDQQNM